MNALSCKAQELAAPRFSIERVYLATPILGFGFSLRDPVLYKRERSVRPLGRAPPSPQCPQLLREQ